MYMSCIELVHRFKLWAVACNRRSSSSFVACQSTMAVIHAFEAKKDGKVWAREGKGWLNTHVPALCCNLAFCHSKIWSYYEYLVGLGHLDHQGKAQISSNIPVCILQKVQPCLGMSKTRSIYDVQVLMELWHSTEGCSRGQVPAEGLCRNVIR